jgi:small subunit ribosomal protein S1
MEVITKVNFSPSQDSNALQDMGALLDSMESKAPMRHGDVVEGQLMRIDPDGILVHIGNKSEGIIPPGEMRTIDSEQRARLKLGDSILTFVVRPEAGERGAILSIDRAVSEKGWHTLEKLQDSEEDITGKLLSFNRGGAIVDVHGVHGFIPISQLVSISREVFSVAHGLTGSNEGEGPASPEDQRASKTSLESEIGKEVSLKILEIDRERNRAIFSEKQALYEKRDERRARLIEELTEGETRRGKITGISNFGAFVELGGGDGLIHISEMSWSPVRSPNDLVKVGQELDVYVLKADAESKKIALSIKRLQPEPWLTINDKYQVGDVVDASVTKLTEFGAFARLDDEEGSIEGLIHVSELTSKTVNHPREIVNEGDKVQLKILKIEPERRRLGLSLRQVIEEEAEEELE